MTYDNSFLKIVIMIRTQISLSKEEYILAKKVSKIQGISFAEFIRISIRQNFPIDKTKPWMQFYGFVESGDKNSSQNIDDIVYGSKI